MSGELADVERMDEDEADVARLQMPDMMQSSGLPFVYADSIESRGISLTDHHSLTAPHCYRFDLFIILLFTHCKC